MELIMISTTKLKVMLSAEDMKKLDFDPCGGGDLSGRAAFRNILREARDRCGFDAVGERVFVQYYPEKHGGCEMFVTKLSKEEKNTASVKECSRAEVKNTGDRPAKGKSDGYIIYRFDRLQGLLSFCSALKRRGYSAHSTFFVTEEKMRKYYIMLEREELSAGEHGGVLLKPSVYHFIAEHGRRVCLDAVNVLGSFG